MSDSTPPVADSTRLPTSILDELSTLDTPTVCNALELVAPERRGYGYTTRPLVCARPERKPVVGYALTARIRARHSPASPADVGRVRQSYYEYIAAGPTPSVIVIQDLDEGYGSWWGEVNSNIHKGFGCLAAITDGSVRDLDDLADGFQVLARHVGPSHAFVHIVDHGANVTVAGMEVAHGDLVHADQHGAVVVPIDAAVQIKQAADLIAARERVVIEAAQRPEFTMDTLRAAWKEAAAIKSEG